MNRRRSAWLVLVAATVTSCGSTVQLRGTAQLGGLGGPTDAPNGIAPLTASQGTTTNTSQSSQGAASGASSSSVAAAGQSSTGTAPNAAVSLGAGHSPVEVGFVTEASDTALAGGLGLSGVNNGDEPSYMNAVVADVNSSGGILGHLVKPIEYRLDPSSTDNFADIEQQECAKFVEDNHAVAALTAFHLTIGQTLTGCMEQHHAATINPTGYSTGGASDFARFPHYFTPPGLVLERQATAYVAGSNAQSFFKGGARIGLISVDAPIFHAAVNHNLVPALSHIGLSLFDSAYYPVPNQTSDLGPTASAIGNAELKFATEGITEVLFLEDGALGVYEFARAASSQHYNPRYAISTTDAPNGLIGLGTPSDQLVNMMGVGWMPEIDAGVANMGPALPQETRCLAVMKRAGLASTDDTVISVQLEYCEELWFLKAAAEAGGGFTAEQLRVGAERLSHGFASPQTPVTLFVAGRHDGVDSTRPFRYLAACSCFRYTGPRTPTP